MAAKLILIRHGESEANLTNCFAGHFDTPLTARGRKQAARTADELRGTHIDAVYASDLRRAFATGEAVAHTHGLPVRPDRGLREISGGAWEKMPFTEMARLYPEETHVWLTDLGRSRCPGGESVAELQQRLDKTVRRISDTHPGEVVCIATHATPIRVLMCLWDDVPLSRIPEIPWVPNASITVAENNGAGGFRLVCRGDDRHLGEIATALPNNV